MNVSNGIKKEKRRKRCNWSYKLEKDEEFEVKKGEMEGNNEIKEKNEF